MTEVDKKKELAKRHTIVCDPTCHDGLAALLKVVVATVLARAKAPRRGKYRVTCQRETLYAGETHSLAIRRHDQESLSWKVSLPADDRGSGRTIHFLVAVPAASQNNGVFTAIKEAARLIDLSTTMKLVQEQVTKAREQAMAHQKQQIKAELKQLAEGLERVAEQSRQTIAALVTSLAHARAEARTAEVQASEMRELIATFR